MAQKCKLTEAAVAAAAAKGEDAWLPDAVVDGLVLKTRKTGVHSWLYRYRPAGRGRAANVQTKTVANYPAVTLKAARDAARILAGHIAKGGDPAAESRKERARQRQRVDAGLDLFERALVRREYKNTATIMSALRRGLAPLATQEIASITRQQVVALIDALEDAGKPGAAEYFRKGARLFLKWSVTRGFREHNPLDGYVRERGTRAQKLAAHARGGRALRDEEIAPFWRACEGLGNFGAMARLCLLAGLRRHEAAGLTWDEIQGDRIVLPATRTKTGEQHDVAVDALGNRSAACQTT